MRRDSVWPVAGLLSLGLLAGAARGDAVAQWHFDESAGPTASDSVGSFDGTLSAAGASFVGGGFAGNALSLDRGSNGLVDMGDVLGFPSGPFSIVAWVNTTSTQADTVVLAKHESFSENGYFLAINPTGGGGAQDLPTFVVSEFVNQSVTATTVVNDGVWHQIVGVYDLEAKTIYVDGAPAEATDASEPMLENAAPFLIGGANNLGTATGGYTGLVDEVQVYDHALGAAEVEFLFENPTQVVPEPGAAGGMAALGALARLRARARRRSASS